MNNGTLPDIIEIVDRRVAAGIAGWAEFELYCKGDLDDDAYSDECKQELLSELAAAQRPKVYVVHVYDTVQVYKIEAASKEEPEERAVKRFQKDKDTWLEPRLAEVTEEYELEEA